MANFSTQNSAFLGTISGTLFSLTVAITPGDVFKTAILAAVGACVSFMVSMIMKWLTTAIKRK